MLLRPLTFTLVNGMTISSLVSLVGMAATAFTLSASPAPQRTQRNVDVRVLLTSGAGAKAHVTSTAGLRLEATAAERNGSVTTITMPTTLHVLRGDSIVVAAIMPVTASDTSRRHVSVTATQLTIVWPKAATHPSIIVSF